MHRPTRLKVADINQHFICVLCDGYLVDATTIIECLHSFCRTCIVRYLENSRYCPVCEVQVHKTKPLGSIKSDATLQDIVYKLIPGLYENEMQRRKDFYADHPEAAAKCSSEERGEGADQRCFYSPQENISLTLEYMHSPSEEKSEDSNNNEEINKKDPMTRYLNCPAALSISNLKKFIRSKFSVPSSYTIEILYDDNLLIDEYTLMDIAYIYTWRRAGPMKFLYSITSSFKKCEVQTSIPMQLDPGKPEELAVPATTNGSNNSDNQVSESKECEKMEVDDSFSNCTSETNISSNSGDLKADSNSETISAGVSPIPNPQHMDTRETEVPPPVTTKTSPKTVPISSAMELIPQSVKIVTTPHHTVISSINNLKLKFVHHPEPPPPKQRSKGKKGGRGSRNKTVPVQRFARLAPYPPPAPPTVPATCLTATPLSQITVGKLVPSVMTSLSPNIMTALVSTTANSLCSSSTNTTLQPTTPFLGQVTTCNVVTCNVTTFSNSFSPSLSNNFPPKSCTASSTDTKLTPSISSSGFMSTLPNSHVITIPTVQKPINILPAVSNTLPTIAVTAAPPVNIKSQLPFSSVTTVPSSESISTFATLELSNNNESVVSKVIETVVISTAPPPLPVISVLSDSSASQRNTSLVQTGLITSTKTCNISTTNPTINIQKPEIVIAAVSKTVDEPEKAPSKILPCDKIKESNGITTSNGMPDNHVSPIKSPSEMSITPLNKSLTNDSVCDSPMFIDKTSDSFEKSVKNSISAEFSDNDDLGCQSDLVVDEHKMDSSDNEDESDVALREKITAIAEKEDEADATDDTEADSGRASDISNQARSSCDDDIGSPMPATTSESDKKAVVTPITTSSSQTTFTVPVSSSSSSVESSNRNAKSNNINHVINNLYKNHEKKDNIGALDLSTCARNLSTCVGTRPKSVANPVLDIKHKQPAYLGPASKQHTACVPAPKHPTSSPILMHGLTARHPLLPSQLHGKPPHIPVSPFHGGPLVFPSQSRAVSTSSCTTGRSTPTYNVSRTASSPVPTAHQALSPMLTGIIPCMNNPIMNSYPIRSPVTLPARSPTHSKGISSPPSIHSKTPPHHGKQPRKSSPALDSHHAKSLTTPNNRNGAIGVVTPGTQASYPKTSTSNMRVSPLHKSASPAPSPKPMVPTLGASSSPTTSSYKSSQQSIPIYKKSDSYKSYKFKNSSNLAVINPDPNGYRQKIVIRNLDVKPNNSSSNNNNNNHHHHHHHQSSK